jgi:hypothetical protein
MINLGKAVISILNYYKWTVPPAEQGSSGSVGSVGNRHDKSDVTYVPRINRYGGYRRQE